MGGGNRVRGGAGEIRRAFPRTGRLGAALAFWSVRGLIALFLIGMVVGLLSIQEGFRLREEIARLDGLRNQGIRLDECAEAVQALERRLATTVRLEGGGNPYALETNSLRERLQALGSLHGAEANPPTGPLLEAVARVEAYGSHSAAGGRDDDTATKLGETVQARWQELRAAWRESTSRSFTAQVIRIQERTRQQRWILLFLGLAALSAVLFPLWITGEGMLRTRSQIEALAAGTPLPRSPAGDGGELRSIRADLGDLAANLAVAEESRFADRHRRDRHLQRLRTTLEAIIDGDRTRVLPPAEEPEWEGVMEALRRLVDRHRAQEEHTRTERALLQKQSMVPREELYQLKQLFELEPEKQNAASQLFGAQSPLRDVAGRIAALAMRQGLLLVQVQERVGKILEHAGTISRAVKEREVEFRRESQLIHETSTTVNEVSVAAKQTAQMVEFVFRSSQEAMQVAEDGRDLVRRSSDGMTLIANRVNQIAGQILQLSSKSQEIGNIVRVIGDISKQTNLLALNAAIEAAGAGEHGKGFAVVAKEIRELAVKSSRSTRDIQQLIQDIQTATNSAVLSTEDGSKSVHDGVRLVNALNQAFGQVIEKFQEVVESAQQISTAAQEQTAGARQVANSISSIDQMMRATVEDLQELRRILEDYQGMTREFAEFLRAPASGGPDA